MGIMDESGLRSFVYSINFQISQIQGRNQHCSGEKNLLLCGLRFLKKKFFQQGSRKKLVLLLQNTSKLWRTWSLALLVHNLFSHLYFCKVSEIMLLKYGHLMLPAEYILDLHCVQYCVWLSNAAIFCKYYTHLLMQKREWIRGVKCLVSLFQKKCPFWPISNPTLNF